MSSVDARQVAARSGIGPTARVRRRRALASRYLVVEPDLQQRVARLEGRVHDFDGRFDGLERRLTSLDDQVSKQFRWLVGGLVTVLVSVIGTLGGALFLR